MFTRLMAQHPIFGDMRGAVNEKGVVLFLVNDVVDMFGLKPERVVARVMASQGTLHWFDLKLQEGGMVSAPMCDVRMLLDLTCDVGRKGKKAMEWVGKKLVADFQDEVKCKKYELDVPPVMERTDKKFDLHFYDDVMMVNHQVFPIFILS